MEEIEHGEQQEQTKEENPSNQEEKIILVLVENQLPEDSQKERNDNAAEINQSLAADQKVGELSQKDSTKKPKRVGSKQNLKAKPTIPQPFSLATDKRTSRERRSSVDFSATTGERMTRERRGSMDFTDSNPKLSKSVSFNHKYRAQSSPTGKEMSDRRHAKSTGSTNKINSKPEVKTTELGDKRTVNGLKTKEKIQLNGIESKYLQVVDKKQKGEDSEINKILKNSTFKASPLPSFYHRKDSRTKPEIKKIPAVTRLKSPLLGQRNKSMPNAENNKTGDKCKKPSKTITSSAKETINKLFRSTRKALSAPKETVKGTVSSA